MQSPIVNRQSPIDQVRVTFLGTGTSHGVPMIGCECATCTSSDPHDQRLRPSILLEYGRAVILVDGQAMDGVLAQPRTQPLPQLLPRCDLLGALIEQLAVRRFERLWMLECET